MIINEESKNCVRSLRAIQINYQAYLTALSTINVKLPAVLLKDSEHPSTDTGFTGKWIDPLEIAA